MLNVLKFKNDAELNKAQEILKAQGVNYDILSSGYAAVLAEVLYQLEQEIDITAEEYQPIIDSIADEIYNADELFEDLSETVREVIDEINLPTLKNISIQSLENNLEILIKKDNLIYAASIRPIAEGSGYIIEMYQNSVDTAAETTEQMLEELSEGKLFTKETETIKDAFDEVFNFYKPIKISVDNLMSTSCVLQCQFKDAVKIFNYSEEKYMIFILE